MKLPIKILKCQTKKCKAKDCEAKRIHKKEWCEFHWRVYVVAWNQKVEFMKMMGKISQEEADELLSSSSSSLKLLW